MCHTCRTLYSISPISLPSYQNHAATKCSLFLIRGIFCFMALGNFILLFVEFTNMCIFQLILFVPFSYDYHFFAAINSHNFYCSQQRYRINQNQDNLWNRPCSWPNYYFLLLFFTLFLMTGLRNSTLLFVERVQLQYPSSIIVYCIASIIACLFTTLCSIPIQLFLNIWLLHHLPRVAPSMKTDT